MSNFNVPKEEFEDTKGVIRSRKSKTDNTVAKSKRTKASSLAATLYQGNPDRNHKFWSFGKAQMIFI
jgi:hypothetical protein